MQSLYAHTGWLTDMDLNAAQGISPSIHNSTWIFTVSLQGPAPTYSLHSVSHEEQQKQAVRPSPAMKLLWKHNT